MMNSQGQTIHSRNSSLWICASLFCRGGDRFGATVAHFLFHFQITYIRDFQDMDVNSSRGTATSAICLPVQLGEVWDDHLFATSHGRLVGADTRGSPVRRRDGVDPGLSLLDNAADELVNHMWVRPVVPPALLK